jgi:HSP20 family protein
VDSDAIEASFDRGVLEVRIPRPEERKPRKVSIGVGGSKPAIEGKESETTEGESA